MHSLLSSDSLVHCPGLEALCWNCKKDQRDVVFDIATAIDGSKIAGIKHIQESIQTLETLQLLLIYRL